MFQIEKTYTTWNWERISRHVLYWLAWLVFFASINSSTNKFGFWDFALLELIVMTVKIVLVYTVIYLLAPKYLYNKRYGIFILLIMVLCIIGAWIQSQLYEHIVHPLIFGYEDGKAYKKVYYLALDLAYVVSLPTMYKLIQRQVQQEKITLQIVEQKLGAELKLLKNQLHPHFLFNTLNNLYGMVLSGHPQAADVVVRLSDLMSYMLYECEGDAIDLEKEIANLRNYIELEKIRYGDRLDIVFETGGDLRDKVIAPLLLIPFFENAFKHGVEKTDQAAWVRINLWVKDQELHFLIENSKTTEVEETTIEATHSGIGLTNVQKRLDLLYPDRYVLNIKEEETFLVQLNLELYS